MTDALKRRCLHLHIDFPNEAQELEILNTKVPGIDKRLAEDVVAMVHRIRALDLKKSPSISETLDWARALMALNAETLDAELVGDTMNIILKYQGDIHKAQSELNKMLADKAAKQRAVAEQPAAPAPTPAAVKKSVLH
jgi:MoxR-like ATPase